MSAQTTREISENTERAYYMDPRTGRQYCARCAWGDRAPAQSPKVDGMEVVWGDISDNGRGCDVCNETRSALIITGIAVIERPMCKIF
jgi:hypothetical protein